MPATKTRPQAPSPSTTPSTRRLSEVARHVVVPSGIVSTGWPAVEAKCVEFGDEFDEWQRGAGRLILGKRADGIYAATIGGIILSIPRQVAKTFLVGRIVFALCCLFPGLKVVWTAHRTRTATQTFQKLRGLAKRKRVAPYVLYERATNGEQEIGFTNGSVIMFGARETGFGRGFDEVDIEVFDEAQILGQRALDDMIAATNQSRHPHGALLFYMGTPPRPTDPGEAFTEHRREALSGESDDAVYIECSADQDAKPDDQKQWAKANPSFPHRTPLRSMLRLRRQLKSDESWLREGLGIWDDTAAKTWLVIRKASWTQRTIAAVRPTRVVFAASASWPDAERAAISVAGAVDGGIAVQVVEVRNGWAWVPNRLEELQRQWNPAAVICRDRGPSSALHAELKARKMDITTPWVRESAAAVQMFCDGITKGEPSPVHHFGQDELEQAVKVAKRKASGDGFLWDQPEPELESAGLAVWGHVVHGSRGGDPGVWVI